jgi:Zn-dependent protease
MVSSRHDMQRYSPRDILVLLAIAALFIWQFAPGASRDPESLLIRVAAIVVAITVHEFNHAFTAYVLGDVTPKLMGRLTLNPLSHLDPIGTILLFIAPFGWGKPVQFNPHNLKVNQAIGSAAVSFAGPLANILLAMALYQGASLGLTRTSPQMAEFVGDALRMNIGLAAFNLLPIPPLDGFGVLEGLLPRRAAAALEPLRTYGPFVLLALVFLPSFGGPSILGIIMDPLVRLITTLVRGG